MWHENTMLLVIQETKVVYTKIRFRKGRTSRHVFIEKLSKAHDKISTEEQNNTLFRVLSFKNTFSRNILQPNFKKH